jgi:hypothetical protein
MDLYVDVGSNEVIDVVTSIIFGLSTLSPDGLLVVKIPPVFNSSLVTMIYLVSVCFDGAYIVRPFADDQLYLIGDDFINIPAKYVKYLFEYADRLFTESDPDLVPFSDRRVNDYVNIIMNINEEFCKLKREHHANLLSVYTEITSTEIGKYFDNAVEKIVSERFSNGASKTWLEIYGDSLLNSNGPKLFE